MKKIISGLIFALLLVSGLVSCKESSGGDEIDAGPDSGAFTVPEVSSFAATAGDELVTLSWENPVAQNFAGVLILRNPEHYPAHTTDGIEVYSGLNKSWVDLDLTNGITYYYAAFSYDEASRYSEGVTASATPYDLPPSNVSFFTAVGGHGLVNLFWENPNDNGFQGVLILKKTTGYPSGIFDGDVVYEGSEEIHTDTEVLSQTTYYYAAFSYDSSLLYSDGARAEATTLDFEPPADISELEAVKGLSEVQFFWTNPQDPDFKGVMVVCNDEHEPVDVNDGLAISLGPLTSFTDPSLTPGYWRYYKFFTYDDYPNFSPGVFKAGRVFRAHFVGNSSESGDIYFETAIATGANGAIHIAYFDYGNKDLKYAYYNGQAWEISRVDGEGVYVGERSSIGVDSAGKVHISYIDLTHGKLKYATNADGTFSSEEIANALNYRTYLRLDNSNKVYITYIPGTSIWYAVKETAGWETHKLINTLQTPYDYHAALDFDNRFHVVYRDIYANELIYFTNAFNPTEGVKTIAASLTATSVFPVIAIHQAESIHIAYTDANSDPRRLIYAVKPYDNGTPWNSSEMANGSFWQEEGEKSLALMNNGSPYLSFCLNSSLYYGAANASSFISQVDPFYKACYYSALAFNGTTPYISYIDFPNRSLKSAFYNGLQWVFQTVDRGSGLDVGLYHALTLDSDSQPHVAFNDRKTDQLLYAYFNGQEWTSPGSVSGAGTLSYHPAIATDDSHNPHVAYADDKMRHSFWNGTVWQGKLLDSAMTPGGKKYSAMVIDPRPGGDFIHVSYFNGMALKHAMYDGYDWSYRLIDQTGIVGKFVALAVDTDQRVHAAYQDESLSCLKYARFSEGVWDTPIAVDSTGIPVGISLQSDADNQPHVSYYIKNGSYYQLRYAAFNGTEWHYETIDSYNNTSQSLLDTSIAVNAFGRPFIAFYDNTRKLYYMTRCQGQWQKVVLVDSVDISFSHPVLALDNINDDLHVLYYEYGTGKLRYLE